MFKPSRYILTLLCLTFMSVFAHATMPKPQKVVLESPSKNNKVEIEISNQIKYSVTFLGEKAIKNARINLRLSHNLTLGKNPRVEKAIKKSVENTLHPVAPRKFKSINAKYNELAITFKDNYQLIFRSYDDGVAYRWVFQKEGKYKVLGELAEFNFTQDYNTWFPEEKRLYSHQERNYLYEPLSAINEERFCSTGMLVELNDGKRMYISESDLESYPGMFLKGSNTSHTLKGKFAYYPKRTEKIDDKNIKVTKRAGYIAKFKGKRSFPWRVIMLAKSDADLLKSELIYQLASPTRIQNTNWVKPGKVIWDWYHSRKLDNVDFEVGPNNKTFEYYIDFASKNNIEYVLLDGGWNRKSKKISDKIIPKKGLNIKALVDYAKKKNVEILLWVGWAPLYNQARMNENLKQFAKWGVKGVKVDFMQRDDQQMVDFYYRLAKTTAKYKLLLNLHGAYKPTGLSRTYPNVLSSEGVRGLEQNKWNTDANAKHNVTIPFIRMVAGPMDYTPGSMFNVTPEKFIPNEESPVSITTRCQQLAMYVIYESPLQMLSESPSKYNKEKESMAFLKEVPVVWDDTKVLSAKIAEQVVMARKSGNRWFLGAMNNEKEKNIEVNLDFLPQGKYKMSIWQDGQNANSNPNELKFIEKVVSANETIQIPLKKNGGYTSIIEKI